MVEKLEKAQNKEEGEKIKLMDKTRRIERSNNKRKDQGKMNL